MARGFIHGELDLKILILYIMSKAEGPVDFPTLTDMTFCDEGVDYFSFAQAAEELVISGHLAFEDGAYSITDKGRRNIAVMESSLSGVVRNRLKTVLRDFNAQVRRQAQVTAQVAEEEGRWQVKMGLTDGTAPILTLAVAAPSPQQGEKVAQRFRERPEEIFTAILNLLTKDLPPEET